MPVLDEITIGCPDGMMLASRPFHMLELYMRKYVGLKLLRSDCSDGSHDIFELEMLQAISCWSLVLTKGDRPLRCWNMTACSSALSNCQRLAYEHLDVVENEVENSRVRGI